MTFLSYENKMHAFINVYTKIHRRVFVWKRENIMRATVQSFKEQMRFNYSEEATITLLGNFSREKRTSVPAKTGSQALPDSVSVMTLSCLNDPKCPSANEQINASYYMPPFK